jgi:hypothetical protein
VLGRAKLFLLRHGKNNSILNQFSDVSSVRGAGGARNLCFSAKKSLFAVDGHFSTAKLLTPLETGPDVVGVVLAYFGTANWNSILSRHDESRTGGMNDRRRLDWVFLWTERGANRWFFDIYIQGSKYNF